jgi:hypothetical protein
MNPNDINISPFKRALMLALIDDEECMQKLTDILNSNQIQASKLERRLQLLRNEQKELEELMIYLNSPTEITND